MVSPDIKRTVRRPQQNRRDPARGANRVLGFFDLIGGSLVGELRELWVIPGVVAYFMALGFGLSLGAVARAKERDAKKSKSSASNKLRFRQRGFGAPRGLRGLTPCRDSARS